MNLQGNGWCGWPAPGGGSGLTHYEQWVNPYDFGFSPTLDVWKQQQYYTWVLNGDRNTIFLNPDGLINASFFIHSQADFADLEPEVLLYWQEQRGSHGNNYGFRAGLCFYENKQTMDLTPNLAAAVTLDGSAADDDIIITDLTTNLDLQYKPNPLTANPLYCHLWIERDNDAASGEAIIYGAKVRYKVSI